MFALAALVAAFPPVAPFPAAISPLDGGALPANGSITIFGGDPVSLAGVGIALTADGAPVDVANAVVGCCAVVVTPSAPLSEGALAQITVTAPGGNAVARFPITAADKRNPDVGAVKIVQVVNASQLSPPMTPHDGPAWVITLDVGGTQDEAGVASLATLDESGDLITIEPPTGAALERLLTGAAGDRTNACITVEVRDFAGHKADATPACVDLPAAPSPSSSPGTAAAGGCAATSTAISGTSIPLALFAIALMALRSSWRRRSRGARGDRSSRTRRSQRAFWSRRRRARPTRSWSPRSRSHLSLADVAVPPRVLLTLCCCAVALLAGCAGRSVDAKQSDLICGDLFPDHTLAPSLFDDDFFNERARHEAGWLTVKVLVVNLMNVDERRVGFYDGDFYHLHDEWFTYRLMNDVDACGGEEIAPYPGHFDTYAAIKSWAKTQAELPPFLSWQATTGRLIAPDFYRLSREQKPRVYAPIYLTRDVRNEPRAYAIRIAGLDECTRDELQAMFDSLDPLMPAGAPLYWKPDPTRPAHVALVDQLTRDHDPLAARVRWDPS